MRVASRANHRRQARPTDTCWLRALELVLALYSLSQRVIGICGPAAGELILPNREASVLGSSGNARFASGRSGASGGVRHASRTFSEQVTPQRHMLHMVAEAMLGADRVAKITGNGPGTANSAAHMSQRAALRPKSSLAVAHSGEIVHTARIDVLVSRRWWRCVHADSFFTLTRSTY